MITAFDTLGGHRSCVMAAAVGQFQTVALVILQARHILILAFVQTNTVEGVLSRSYSISLFLPCSMLAQVINLYVDAHCKAYSTLVVTI